MAAFPPMLLQLLFDPAIAPATPTTLQSAEHGPCVPGLAPRVHARSAVAVESPPVAALQTSLENPHEKHCGSWHELTAIDDRTQTQSSLGFDKGRSTWCLIWRPWPGALKRLVGD
jgi:hypothetical protein